MYPGMMYWWKTHRHGGGCHAAHYAEGEQRHGRHRHRAWREYESAPHGGDLGAGGFGVRRPLRFLAFELDLDEQRSPSWRILDDLKTERAQAEGGRAAVDRGLRRLAERRGLRRREGRRGRRHAGSDRGAPARCRRHALSRIHATLERHNASASHI
jgi:hypothetical protein